MATMLQAIHLHLQHTGITTVPTVTDNQNNQTAAILQEALAAAGIKVDDQINGNMGKGAVLLIVGSKP